MKLLMKSLVLILAALIFFSISCVAATLTLQWDLSVDDNLLGSGGGYRIYQGKTSGQYDKTPIATVGAGVSTVTFNPGGFGTYYWVATAFDSNGNESSYSNEVSQKIVPGAPTNLKIPTGGNK